MKGADTAVKLQPDLVATFGPLLKTPPLPAGDKSTPKQKPKANRN